MTSGEDPECRVTLWWPGSDLELSYRAHESAARAFAAAAHPRIVVTIDYVLGSPLQMMPCEQLWT